VGVEGTPPPAIWECEPIPGFPGMQKPAVLINTWWSDVLV
jgi:hypothetical protein